MLNVMLNKASVLALLKKFPEQLVLDELIDQLILLQKIEKGKIQADQGEVVSDEEAKKRMGKWQK